MRKPLPSAALPLRPMTMPADTPTVHDEPDHADVLIRPPLLFCIALVIGSAISAALPIGPGLAKGDGRALAWGIGLAVIGTIFTTLAARELVRAGTEVMPTRPSTAVVTSGVYGFTRNPIYIGLSLIYFGISVALTSMWSLALLPLVLFLLQRGVILREEAYLARKFGAVYEAYRARVPRWF